MMHALLSLAHPHAHRLKAPRAINGRVVAESTWSRQLRYRVVLLTKSTCSCGRAKSSVTMTKRFISYEGAAAVAERKIATMRRSAVAEFEVQKTLLNVWAVVQKIGARHA